MRMASMRESQDSDRFLVNTQEIQSHAVLRRGFGTSVPFIFLSRCTRLYFVGVFLSSKSRILTFVNHLYCGTIMCDDRNFSDSGIHVHS